MSDFYGVTDETASVATVHAALDAGITLLDTGDFYGMGHNEMLLAQVLKTRRNEAFVCVTWGDATGVATLPPGDSPTAGPMRPAS